MSDPGKWGIDLTPDEADTFMAAICEARRGPDLPDPLVALRAEVEKLRKKAAPHCEIGPVTLNGWIAGSYVAAYDRVLDLIDKHIRSAAMDEPRAADPGDGRPSDWTCPMTSDRDQLAELIGAVLQGIDQTEIPDDGWWETSGGADFGARKKDELIDAILAAGWRPTTARTSSPDTPAPPPPAAS